MSEVRHTGTSRQARPWLAVIVGSSLVAAMSLSIATAASAAEFTTLTARHSGKLAQVPAGSGDGAQLAQNAATGATNQRWEVRDAGGGYVQLVNGATGKCLDVLGASVDNGAAAVQSTCGTAASQQWQLRDAGGGYVNLVARHSGKCLDVLNRLTTDGAALGQWTCGTGTNQQWQRTDV